MPNRRGKPKFYHDWQFVIPLRDGREQVPVRTTLDGVKVLVSLDGGVGSRNPNGKEVTDVVTLIQDGGCFDLIKGPIKQIHRRLPSIEDLLFEVSSKIRKTGQHSACWWHKYDCVVWWCAEDIDARLARSMTGDCVTDSDQIVAMFMTVPGVKQARVVIDAVPNLRKDSTWIEVYPSYQS